MEKRFHQLAAEIAMSAMPEGYREKFLSGFSFELLLEYADVPYVTDRYGEPEHLHIDHTYKLYLKGRDLHHVGDGNALEEVVSFSKSIQQLSKEGNGLLVRYNIAKATHYVIDLATFPHVIDKDWDKYHTAFEDHAANWLEAHKTLVDELVINYKPNAMRSVQNRMRAIAERTYFHSLDFLPCYKRNSQITDLQWVNLSVKHIYDLMDWFATFQNQL